MLNNVRLITTLQSARINPLPFLFQFAVFISGCCYCCCSVAQSCPTLCDPTDCSAPDFPVLHHLPELAQTHIHGVSDAIQPSCPLLPPSLTALNLLQHQDVFQLVRASHQVAKVLELQLPLIFRVDFL